MDASPFGWVSDLASAERRRSGGRTVAGQDAPVYLRFGALPPGGRPSIWRREWMASGRTPPFGFESPDFPQHGYEPGVSVFRARRILAGRPNTYEVDVSLNIDVATLFRLLASFGQQPYSVKGTELPELGFVDEPMLVDASAEPLPMGTVVRCTRHFAVQADALWRHR